MDKMCSFGEISAACETQNLNCYLPGKHLERRSAVNVEPQLNNLELHKNCA